MSICAILLLLENWRKDKIIKKLIEKPNDKPSWEEITENKRLRKELEELVIKLKEK